MFYDSFSLPLLILGNCSLVDSVGKLVLVSILVSILFLRVSVRETVKDQKLECDEVRERERESSRKSFPLIHSNSFPTFSRYPHPMDIIIWTNMYSFGAIGQKSAPIHKMELQMTVNDLGIAYHTNATHERNHWLNYDRRLSINRLNDHESLNWARITNVQKSYLVTLVNMGKWLIVQ